jgi:hypothetical protein
MQHALCEGMHYKQLRIITAVVTTVLNNVAESVLH